MSNNGAAGGPAPVFPSQFNPKSNGATGPQTPTPAPAPFAGAPSATPAPAPAVQTPSEVEQLRSKLADAERREGLEKRTRITEKRQWERERLSFGEKLKSADEYARLKREANVNPVSAAKALWGDKWHEHLNTVAANGGAPTAESVAAEIEAAERRAEEKFQAQRAEEQKAAQEARQHRVDAQLRAFNASAVEYATANAKDYPVFSAFKSPERIAGALVQRVRDVHDASVVRDADTGEVITPGRIIGFKEAAELLEADLLEVAKAAVSAEGYREKLTPAKTPGNASPVGAVPSSQSQQPQSPSSQPQGRRSLSNDLTGSTRPNAPEILTDDERMRRALAKYAEVVAAKGKA